MSSAIDALFQPRVSTLDLERGAQALNRLASWWLRETALDRLRKDDGIAHLANGDLALLPNEFLVLLVCKHDSEVVEPAFGLPLMWARATAPASPVPLPAQLAQIADDAKIRLMQSQGQRKDEINALDLRLGTGCPDLTGIRLTFDSAAAAVEAALRCALQDSAPSHTHAVSAAVGKFGLERVEGIADKRRAAARHGITMLLMAPGQDAGEADQTAPHSVEVQHLRQASLEEQLGDIVAYFDVAPSGAEIAKRFQWYGRQPTDPKRPKIGFFVQELAPAIIEHLRRDHASGQAAPGALGGGLPQPGLDTLVLTAGGDRHETAILAALLHRPRMIVVLERRSPGAKESDGSRVIDAMREHLGNGIKFIFEPWCRSPDSSNRIFEKLDGHVEGARRVGVDLSGGPKDDAIELLDWHRSRDSSTQGPATYISIAHLPPRTVQDYSVTDFSRRKLGGAGTIARH